MSKKTIALIGILILITAVLLFIAFKPKTSSPNEVTTIAPTQATAPVPKKVGSTTLNLMPNPLQMTTSSASLDAVINAGTDKITAVQLEIAYDPKALTVVSITPGSFFSNPFVLLNSIDNNNGRISYALGINVSDSSKAGTGVVATIVVKANNTATVSETDVTFLPKSLVTAEKVSDSVLINSQGAKIILPTN